MLHQDVGINITTELLGDTEISKNQFTERKKVEV